MQAAPLTVEVLSLPGCPHVEETLARAKEVVSAVVPGAAVLDVRLSASEARERGFPGSPTVLVNGMDIEGRGAHAAGVA
jgi:hypothetical protein